MLRKSIALLIAGTMLLSAGCSATGAADENGNISVDGNPTVEHAEEPNDPIEESDKDSEAAQDIDTSVMKPWINSNIMGIVTDDVNADLKDDFYLNINHDYLRDAKLRPGYPAEFPILDASDTVKERCLDILTDKSLT